MKEKRLCDLVEIEENNIDYVLLKVKENSMLDLIKLGCFEGDETLIRVTKGANHIFTIFSDNKHFSWEYGISGYTLVSKNVDKKRELILECIENDYDIYIGENKKLIEKSLNIHSLKDTQNKVHQIKIMYWEKDKDTNVTIHKDGEFFRHFPGVKSAKEYLEKLNYTLNFIGEYVAQTGCIVEEYSIKRKEYSNEKNSLLNQKKEHDVDYDYE